MVLQPSQRISRLGAYPFAELDSKVAQLRKEGHDPIDFGVGDPNLPTPEVIRAAAAEGLARHKESGYPSYEGEPYFRQAAAAWMQRRFGVSLDPNREINITLGSKESIFNLPEAFIDPGDVVLSPSPGYPPYARGTEFAEGENFFYPLTAENRFLPDLESIPTEIAQRARLFWICQPQAPTGRMLERADMEHLIAFCRDHSILLCSDEAYIDLFYEVPPLSLIQCARQGVLVFYSLSKRSAMTGYRCGWVAGDPEAIALFRRLKTNIDSGVPRFVQDAAQAALTDETHVKNSRLGYKKARDLLVDALARAGLPRCPPQAGLFIWQRSATGSSGLELAKRLLAPDLALVTSPGEWLASPVSPDGENPGKDYIRFALTPPMHRVEEAVLRLRRANLGPE